MVNRLYYGGSAAIELEGEKIDVVVDSMIMERERGCNAWKSLCGCFCGIIRLKLSGMGIECNTLVIYNGNSVIL